MYLENAENAEKITKEYKSDYSALVADTVNSYKLQTEAQDMYMGITVVLVVSICAVTILVVLFILYIVIKLSACKKKTGVRYLQSNGLHKFTAYFTDNRFIYACVDGGNCDFKLFGNLLYAGYLSIYFRDFGCHEK